VRRHRKYLRVQNMLMPSALIAVALCITSASAQEYDFRHTRWGMALEEVKAAESGPPDDEYSHGDVLLYKTMLLDEKVVVVYRFAFNKLVSARYDLAKYTWYYWALFDPGAEINRTPAVIKGEFVGDFDKFKGELAQKYGQPFDDKWVVKAGDTPKTKDAAGLDSLDAIVRSGRGGLYARWKTNRTDIALIVSGDGDLHFQIVYSTRDSTYRRDGL